MLTTEEYTQFKRIAREQAIRLSHTHSYLEGASSPSWEPHEWVLEAIREAYDLGQENLDYLARGGIYNEGWEAGHDEGYSEARSDMQEEIDEAYKQGVQDGKDSVMEDGRQ